MTDYRIVTDEELNRHYADHPHIRYCDVHDDFAIAYIAVSIQITRFLKFAP